MGIVSCNSINTYAEEAGSTAIYPEAGTSSPLALSYVALGLNGEAGEVAEKIKKWIRDAPIDPSTGHPEISDEMRESIQKELGDVAWYWARMHAELGLSPSFTLGINVEKLAARKRSNSLGGSGDDR